MIDIIITLYEDVEIKIISFQHNGFRQTIFST